MKKKIKPKTFTEELQAELRWYGPRMSDELRRRVAFLMAFVDWKGLEPELRQRYQVWLKERKK